MKSQKKKVAYFGYLPSQSVATGGAEVKTRSILSELKKLNVADQYRVYDTSGWKKKIIGLMFALLSSLFTCDHIIIVSRTAQFLMMLRFISPLNRLCRRGVHFIPVGDCKASYFNKGDKTRTLRVNGIYVETSTMREGLVQSGVNNVYVLTNFKHLESFHSKYDRGGPLRFCYFARVAEEKGILEAIEVFAKVNAGGVRCILDVYGNVENDVQPRFSNMLQEYADFVKYRGNVSPDLSSTCLKNYYMMVFPTKVGEGFPGSLIDAFAAGLPILSSRFRYFHDILIEGTTAISFALKDFSDMEAKLEWSLGHEEEVNAMRGACCEEYSKYTPSQAIKVLIERM